MPGLAPVHDGPARGLKAMGETRPRRVLLVVNTLPPLDLSGAGEQVVQLASGLRTLGVEVDLLGRGSGGARGPKMLFPFTVIWPAIRRIRSGSYDAVQVHESDGGLLALVVRCLRFALPRFQLVALLQVSYDEERRAVRPLRDSEQGEIAWPTPSEQRFRRWRTPAQRLLGRWSAWFADVVFVPSQRTGDEIRRDYGGCRPLVLPNAGRAEDLADDALPGVVSRRKGEAPLRLLFVGRLRIRKGVEVLLHALSAMRRQGTDVELRLAGDGERSEVLRDLSRELDLQDRVQFLGKCDRDRLSLEFDACDALVVPSIYEGMPLVVLEAMARAVPVVASAVSGIPEVVLDGETGWLVPPENVEALQIALTEVSEDLDSARARGRAGRERLSLFRPERVADLWLRAVFSG